MTSMIIDTGPLVALLNRRDAFHTWAKEVLAAVQPPLFTCEAVISEACFLVRNLTGGSQAVLALLTRDIIQIDFQLSHELANVHKLMAKYAHMPMSLADACLVRMTELNGKHRILTLDNDFRIYRRHRRQIIPAIFPD